MKRLVSDNAVTRLAVYAETGDETIEVDDGGVFPDPEEGEEFFDVTLPHRVKGREVDWETCRVTKRDGNTLHVERAAYDTTLRNWPSGTAVELRLNSDLIGWVADGGRDRETGDKYRLVIVDGYLATEEV